MAEQLLLVDSDIFALLAAVELLDELALALGIPVESVRRLPALGKQLRPGKSIGRKYPELQRQKALTKCDATEVYSDRPAAMSLHAKLVSVDDIDEGEAVLLAALAEQQNWYLTSGDKRSLIALGQTTELSDVRDRVAGRILALECVLLLLVKRLGAAELGKRFQLIPGAHNTIDILFRFKNTFDDDESIRQITSYLNDLVQKMGRDLLYPV